MKKINRIFIFGDSWMEGQGAFDVETLSEWIGPDSEPKYPFKGPNGLLGEKGTIGWKRKEETWNKFFREEYNIEVNNLAQQGQSNYWSFELLNKNLKDFKDTDLILFGFTSKWRDNSRAIKYAWPDDKHENIATAHHRHGVKDEAYKADLDGSKGFVEKPTEFEKYFYSSIFNEDVYENIAQTNYIFYQTYAKENNLNIIFFDLFDRYVDINKCKPELRYLIDKNMYVTFGKPTYLEKLIKYEQLNYDINKMEWDRPENQYTIWEFKNGSSPPGWRFPKQDDYTCHPNQFGYKLIFEDLVTYINKEYDI